MGRDGLWRSRSCLGPWEAIPELINDGAVVQKVAPFGARYVMAGWLSDSGGSGNLIFRELVQSEDGLLGVGFLPEMRPRACAAVVSGSHLALEGGNSTELVARAPCSFSLAMSLAVPMGRFELTLGSGLVIQCSMPGAVHFRTSGSCSQVDGFKELGDVTAPRGASLSLELVVADDIVDLCIDERRYMLGRFTSLKVGPLWLRAVTEAITLRGFSVCPLEETFTKGSRSW